MAADLGPFPEGGKKLRKDARLEDVYSLGSIIGTGGFSEVQVATDRAIRHQCACKSMPLPPADSESKAERQARMAALREISSMLGLEHPNVVGLREYFVESNRVYLIMELLRGGELLDAVNTHGPFSEEDARTIFLQLMRGVQYLHSVGVVHRDLKLDNLLLAKKGDISCLKIADFGVAMKGSPAVLNSMRTVCGSPQYIAPEVICAGKKRDAASTDADLDGYGPACDLWSCGVILFMLLGGYPPFWHESKPQLLEAVERGEFEFADPVWQEVSWQAKDLVSKLLVVDPDKRLTPAQA
ncbi:hypothetical protein CHLNCDRAFT_37582, partial [Chlorella variabilis]